MPTTSRPVMGELVRVVDPLFTLAERQALGGPREAITD
jgi:hypothetical protein